jgi:hypothetical protein
MEANMRSWLWKGMLGAAVALPAPNGAAWASCSLATLTGEYAFGATVYNPPTKPPPITVVEGIKRFDGNGHLTQRDFGPDRPPEFAAPGTEFGTYTVDPNCTGSLDITILAPPICPGQNGEIQALIVISNGGRHIHEVVSKLIPPCNMGNPQAGTPETSADDWKVEGVGDNSQ